MRLVGLTYASTLTRGTDPSEYANIRNVANEYNLSKGISGILLFGDNYFLQRLEGGREVVNLLFTKISKDPRHEHILLLEYAEITERNFNNWGMKVILMTKENNKRILKYGLKNEFMPYEMSGASALALMNSFKSE
jgi:hypothetical protein